MVQIVYVDEYQPSSAKVTIGDPIYQRAAQSERIRIRRRLAAPSPLALVAIGIIVYIILKG